MMMYGEISKKRPYKNKLMNYLSYHLWLFLKFCYRFFFNEVGVTLLQDTTSHDKHQTLSLFNEIVAFYYPLSFFPDTPFTMKRNGVIICNHVHPTLDIFSLQYFAHLFKLNITFVGHIDLREKNATNPFKLYIGIQNLPYNIQKGLHGMNAWDTSLSSWIARRVSFIPIEWDKETNKPVSGSYPNIKRQGGQVLRNGGFIVGFPEGCYDGTYDEKPFYDGFFKLAVDTKKPIYVCTLLYRDMKTKEPLTGNNIRHSKEVECIIILHTVIETEYINQVDKIKEISYLCMRNQINELHDK